MKKKFIATLVAVAVAVGITFTANTFLKNGAMIQAQAKENHDISPAVVPEDVAKFKFPTNTVITSAKKISGDSITINGEKVSLPNYTKIEGRINQRIGTDSKEYYIGFELRLPDKWNERFLFQGGAGADGIILPPVGAAPNGTGTGNAPALARGFAIVSSDSGHQTPNGQFGVDQQARLDYSYNFIGQVTATAKSIINDYYSEPAKYSYYFGGSNGGRQALIAAQRFGNEFDGIISGDPALNVTNAGIGEMWNTQTLSQIAKKDANGLPILNTAFSDADLKLVSNTILKQLDEADGLEDGLVSDIEAARKFDVSKLPRKTADSDGLTDDQINALKKIFDGAKDSKAKQLYSNWPWDPGIADIGWKGWNEGTETMPAYNVLLGADAMANIFMTPSANIDSNNITGLLKWSLAYNFDTDPGKEKLTEALHNAVSTNYSEFKNHNGKIMIFQGMADPVFSAYDLIDYYNKVAAVNGGLRETQDFARLYLIPGMGHVTGGPATDQFDMLTAIVDWTENGKSPDKIVASGSKGGQMEGVNRPLFPYPKQAVYDGKGDKNSAESFIAKTPEK